MRYLSEKFDKWNLIPKDLKARTQVNALLDEHHNSTRQGAARIFWMEFMSPQMGKEIPTPLLKDAQSTLRQALKRLESRLSDTNAYLAGNKLTFADMLSYSELKQLDLVAYDFSPYPAVSKWMKLMSEVPNHDKVFDVLDKLVAISAKKKAAAAAASKAKL